MAQVIHLIAGSSGSLGSPQERKKDRISSVHLRFQWLAKLCPQMTPIKEKKKKRKTPHSLFAVLRSVGSPDPISPESNECVRFVCLLDVCVRVCVSVCVCVCVCVCVLTSSHLRRTGGSSAILCLFALPLPHLSVEKQTSPPATPWIKPPKHSCYKN